MGMEEASREWETSRLQNSVYHRVDRKKGTAHISIVASSWLTPSTEVFYTDRLGKYSVEVFNQLLD